MATRTYSCPDKEDRSSRGWRQDKNKVQDQMLALSVHTIARRSREGGEVETESAAW